jgi:hypothetical protein
MIEYTSEIARGINNYPPLSLQTKKNLPLQPTKPIKNKHNCLFLLTAEYTGNTDGEHWENYFLSTNLHKSL